MTTTNRIIHTINKNDERANYQIKVSLADECKNGHEDFHVTATFWEVGKPRVDRYFTSAGSCHDAILKARPDLKIFADLHGNDFRGYPMYYVGNMKFHRFNKRGSSIMSKKRFMEYYHVTEKEYEILGLADTEDEFGYLLFNVIQNNKKWEELGRKGIEYIEELSGMKFESKLIKLADYSKYQKLQFPDDWFKVENVERRRAAEAALKKQEAIKKAKDSFNAKVEEMRCEHEIKVALMELGFLDLGNTRFYYSQREFHINVPQKTAGTYRIENSDYNYTFTQDDYNQMHIALPAGFKLIFNDYGKEAE